MANHLATETSPYLRQHRDNPVDWYPWGPEALARARDEDKPILLSVGYSTCHWCHVMARECFEDADVAAAMNRDFVCVKVDREERPDLDQIYQGALQLLTRRPGGWPLTLFLTPDQTPFYGGTYFPRQASHGLPGFMHILANVAAAYRERRTEIERQNLEVRAALVERPQAPATGEWRIAPRDQALADIQAGFDPEHGGFGRAPKFPRPAELEFLLWSGDESARQRVLFTLERMALGGLMDQLGGGFFRYAVDAAWRIPHFEKMLYDNGPLLGLYADAWSLTGHPLFRRVAEELVGWLTREMTAPEGCFFAAQDADSEHEEGRFYVWTPEAVAALLTPEENALATAVWGLDQAPNFEGRAWHLNVERNLAVVARDLECPLETAVARLASARARLFAARERRIRPGRDDKVLTAWNALMIKGLARAARRFARPEWRVLAQTAVDALAARVWRQGRLLAGYTDGQARHNGYLDDYAFLLDALLELLQAEWRPQDWCWALALAEGLLTRFQDDAGGGFYFTSHDHETLIQRPKSAHDQAQPSGNGVAARALYRVGMVSGDARHGAAAAAALGAFLEAARAQPAAYPSLMGVLEDHLKPPCLAVIQGPAPARLDWLDAINRLAPPRHLVFAPGRDVTEPPMALRKPTRNHVNAHACCGVTCMPEIFQLTDLMDVFRNWDVQ